MSTLSLRRALTILILLCLVVPAVGCWEEKQPATWKSATGPEALEKLFWDEVKAKNWAEIERHVGPTFVAVNSRGALDRAALMERVKQLDIDDYSLGNV